MAAILFPARESISKTGLQESLSWLEFQRQMMMLAIAEENGSINKGQVSDRGMQYLSQLDIS